jgi:hypothetical protein
MKTHRSIPFLLACGLLAACSLPQAATSTPAAADLPAPKPSNTPEPLPADTPIPAGNITYFWPLVLEGLDLGPIPVDTLALDPDQSSADPNGFTLSFNDAQGVGVLLTLWGGAHADTYEYCRGVPGNPSAPVTVRGLEGCFPASTGAGQAVEWKENGVHYVVGGMGVSRVLALERLFENSIIGPDDGAPGGS